MSSIPPLLRRFFPRNKSARKQPKINDSGHGYDPFGAHPDWIELGFELTRFFHDQYFRVQATGIEHIPRSGPTLITANHSGTLPFDAIMLWANLIRVLDPPRIPRAIADYFVTGIPLINLLFARMGVVGGSRDNANFLLSKGELLMVFPEGVAGIGKSYDQKYRLQKWNWGHAELSIRHQAPIVPCAIIGAEEQMPQLAKIQRRRGKIFGVPYIPIPATPFPLPVRYQIHYGPPLHLYNSYSNESIDDPYAMRAAAQEVQDAVQKLVDDGLRARKSVF